MHIRIPGWAQNEPVPGDLYRYTDSSNTLPSLKVNGEEFVYQTVDGYAVINKKWQKGDIVELILPMPVRKVLSHPDVKDNSGKVAIERGPLVYCFETVDNGGDIEFVLTEQTALHPLDEPELLNGITILRGKVPSAGNNHVEPAREISAIPYYARAHRGDVSMKVWLPLH